MKNYKLNKHLLWLSLGCLLFLNYQQANAQVEKAMKYAWFFDYERAEKFLTNTNNELNDSMVVQLAEILYLQGKYPQALYYYKIADRKGAIQTNQIRRNYVFASTMMREKSPYFKKTNYFNDNYFLYTVIDTFAGNSLNEDFSSFFWNDMLFVTTSRRTTSNEKAFQYVYTKMPYLDVYPFTEAGKRLRYPSYFPKTINTSMHDGPIAITLDTNLIVLTRNYSKANSNKVQYLYLTYYVRDANRKWSRAQTFNFCRPGFSAQHPYYNETEKALYFSSDMPGGLGGFDLYKTHWNGTEWTPPENLGSEINSEYDEVFPSFTTEGELSYATNHIETTGGLDIVLYSNGNRYLLNEPFNTIYDDFGIMFKSKKEGYFSSNRFSNKFDDNIYHFILSEPERQTLFVKTFDAGTGAELDQVKVGFSTPDGSFSGVITTVAGNYNIVIQDTAEARKPMHFTASKPGYMDYDLSNNEYFVKEGRLLKEIFLQKSPVYAGDDYYVVEDNQRSSKFPSILTNDSLYAAVVQKNDVYLHVLKNPLEGFLSIDNEDGKIKISSGIMPGNYRIKYVICSQKAPQLCDTAQVMIDIRANETEERKPKKDVAEENTTPETPGIKVVNDIGYTTTNGGYVLNVRNNDRINNRKANKINSVIRNVNSDNPDIQLNRKTGAITMKKGVEPGTYNLSYELNERGNREAMSKATVSIVVRNRNQIPGKGPNGNASAKTSNTVIYFDNDEPKTFQIFRPAFSYQNSYESYVKQMDEFYDKSVDSKESLDDFFTNHVDAGYQDLKADLELIQSSLDQGVQVEILVTAYCSPIASTQYNSKLSNRRLISLIRYLKKWNDGALSDAIESNRITLWEHSVGELEAPKDVSEDFNKLNESVFGIKASRERRISITVKIMGSN